MCAGKACERVDTKITETFGGVRFRVWNRERKGAVCQHIVTH